MTRSRAVLLIASLAIALALGLAARPAPASDAERTERIASELRCPVCQGLSVRDSPSETARQMRDVVAQRVAEGRSDDEIRAEFRGSYGDWVLLSPPLLSWSGLVWLFPIAAVAAGFLVASAMLRRGRPDVGPQPSREELARLRERAAAEEGAE